MIPYWQPGPWHLGPFTIYPFGVMVGLAILIGTAVGQKKAERVGLHPRYFSEMVIWMFVIAFIVAHIVSVVFYFPERLKKDPLALIKIWQGISSFGGFLGAVGTILVYSRIRKMPVWTTCDSVGYGLVHGWILGRVGCSLAHDHPGKCTDFFLGIRYPNAATACHGLPARHDLGFYEMLFTISLTVAMVLANRKKRFAGFNVALICLAYGPARFAMDFLRTGDPHYLGLTAGHYFSVVVFGLGIWILVTRRNAPPEDFQPYDPEEDVGGLMVPVEKKAEDDKDTSEKKPSKDSSER